uniref:SAM domain-containing protein n=1 Tax=Zooxanthella nutricula TaxID=1333877 RepID=A0A7S2IBD0_9DINO
MACCGAGPESAAPPQQRQVFATGAAVILAWAPEDVARHFAARGYPQYAQMWVEHDVAGRRLVHLTRADLEIMGIHRMGDLIGLAEEVAALRKIVENGDRLKDREVIEEHVRAGDGCRKALCEQGERYVLTKNTLQLETYHVARCCCVPCSCCGAEWKTDNIDLERIVDIDTTQMVVGCCKRRCRVDVACQAGTEANSAEARVARKSLFLRFKEGLAFAAQIRAQADERKQVMGSWAGRQRG